jgi:hypothetical protein
MHRTLIGAVYAAVAASSAVAFTHALDSAYRLCQNLLPVPTSYAQQTLAFLRRICLAEAFSVTS